MTRADEMLLALWREPARARVLADGDWDVLLRVADAAGLLGRLGERLALFGHVDAVPPAVRRHFDAACRLAAAHHRNVRWEARRIIEALGSAGLSFIVLKGAAYVLADLPCARGRVFEDVDILVPKSDLDRAESALGVHGWVTMHRHAYDQRYYRRWMHEIPPMRHVRRGSTIDVHHALLPDTAPVHPDAECFWRDREPLSDWPGAFRPCREDLVLHAAAHLFFDGAFENGLRDLVDIDELLRHFGRSDDFWDGLHERAGIMDLLVPIADALCWSQRLLGTPIPQEALDRALAAGRPRWRAALVRPLMRAGLRPDHPLCRDAGTQLARGLLYVRSHRLRMPPHLIVPHLLRKALRPVDQDRV